MQVVNGERYVLRVVPIKHPYLTICGRARHAVADVVEEDALLFGVASQPNAQLAHLLAPRFGALAARDGMGARRAARKQRAGVVARASTSSCVGSSDWR